MLDGDGSEGDGGMTDGKAERVKHDELMILPSAGSAGKPTKNMPCSCSGNLTLIASAFNPP